MLAVPVTELALAQIEKLQLPGLINVLPNALEYPPTITFVLPLVIVKLAVDGVVLGSPPNVSSAK